MLSDFLEVVPPARGQIGATLCANKAKKSPSQSDMSLSNAANVTHACCVGGISLLSGEIAVYPNEHGGKTSCGKW